MIGSGDDDCVDVVAIEQAAKVFELGNLFFTHLGRPLAKGIVHVANRDRLDVGLRQKTPPVAGAHAATSNDPNSDSVIGTENSGRTHAQAGTRRQGSRK